MIIEREGEVSLTPVQELTLLRAAYTGSRDGRGAEMLRAKLAALLFLDEAYDELIALYKDSPAENFAHQILLILAHLSKEDRAHDIAAFDAASRAFSLAGDAREQAAALAYQGKAKTRLGEDENALQLLEEAIALDPSNKDACKRIAAFHLKRGDASTALAFAQHQIAAGIGHSRMISAKSLAEARAGNATAARDTVAMDSFFDRTRLSVPDGFASLTEFNAALAQELLNHPAMRFERTGSASVKTWRVESPARTDAPLIRTLLDNIQQAISSPVARHSRSSHAWANAKPDRALLRSWCVITEGEGFEDWHVHQFGWLSGVYYVQVPETISQGNSKEGCLAFGLPEDLAGQAGAEAFGETLVRPEEGMLLTFPSHCYHRTYPHHGTGKRICYAFDLRPMD
jgi:uncharacterized protein (TIGR02466 family)